MLFGLGLRQAQAQNNTLGCRLLQFIQLLLFAESRRQAEPVKAVLAAADAEAYFQREEAWNHPVIPDSSDLAPADSQKR